MKNHELNIGIFSCAALQYLNVATGFAETMIPLSGTDWRIHEDPDGKGAEQRLFEADVSLPGWIPATVFFLTSCTPDSDEEFLTNLEAPKTSSSKNYSGAAVPSARKTSPILSLSSKSRPPHGRPFVGVSPLVRTNKDRRWGQSADRSPIDPPRKISPVRGISAS